MQAASNCAQLAIQSVVWSTDHECRVAASNFGVRLITVRPFPHPERPARSSARICWTAAENRWQRLLVPMSRVLWFPPSQQGSVRTNICLHIRSTRKAVSAAARTPRSVRPAANACRRTMSLRGIRLNSLEIFQFLKKTLLSTLGTWRGLRWRIRGPVLMRSGHPPSLLIGHA